MREAMKRRYREILFRRREELLKESHGRLKVSRSGERQQTVGGGLDPADQSVQHHCDTIQCWQFETEKNIIKKIELALRRIEEDAYGICEDCQDEIDEKRLRILPYALYCRGCQELQEEEEIERRR
jgi:DnaK suppressor protein